MKSYITIKYINFGGSSIDLLSLLKQNITKFSNNVCYHTIANLVKILQREKCMRIDNYNIIKQTPRDLVNIIKNCLCDKLKMFLLVSKQGHVYLIEIDPSEKYIRFYQSYGGRFSLKKWIDDKDNVLEQHQQISTGRGNYSYDVSYAEIVRNKFGKGQKLQGSVLCDFLQVLCEMDKIYKSEYNDINEKYQAFVEKEKEIVGVLPPILYESVSITDDTFKFNLGMYRHDPN